MLSKHKSAFTVDYVDPKSRVGCFTPRDSMGQDLPSDQLGKARPMVLVCYPWETTSLVST